MVCLLRNWASMKPVYICVKDGLEDVSPGFGYISSDLNKAIETKRHLMIKKKNL